MLVTRIIFLCFQNDVNCSYTLCHSEKAENLAISVDFRLIQNLSMLILLLNSNKKDLAEIPQGLFISFSQT